jgi:hypothetical protein
MTLILIDTSRLATNPVSSKKRGDERKKELLTMHARLCGGGHSLKALGSVASYLADALFYLSK